MNGSYLRLKTAEISYTLPQKDFLKKVGINDIGLQRYVWQGELLYPFDLYSQPKQDRRNGKLLFERKATTADASSLVK